MRRGFRRDAVLQYRYGGYNLEYRKSIHWKGVKCRDEGCNSRDPRSTDKATPNTALAV